MSFQAIQYVTSGATLVAFVVAVVFFYLGQRLRNRAQIIESAPDEKRIEAIRETADQFRLDLSHLNPDQQLKVVLEQIKIRARREVMIAIVVTIIAVLLFANNTKISATFSSENQDVIIKPKPGPIPVLTPDPAPKKIEWLTQEVRAAAKISAGVSGTREHCSGGTAEDCVRPQKPNGRLVVGSGSMSQFQSTLAVGNGTTITVITNTPAMICIRITATTGDCRFWNAASGFVTATEEYPATP